MTMWFCICFGGMGVIVGDVGGKLGTGGIGIIRGHKRHWY